MVSNKVSRAAKYIKAIGCRKSIIKSSHALNIEPKLTFQTLLVSNLKFDLGFSISDWTFCKFHESNHNREDNHHKYCLTVVVRWKNINYYKGYFLNWCQQCQPYQKTLVDCHKFGYSTRLMHTMLILKKLIKQVLRNEQFVRKENKYACCKFATVVDCCV